MRTSQAELYIPTIASSTFGIVRAYQKDGTDIETGNAAVIYVDSDGLVAQNALEAPVSWLDGAIQCRHVLVAQHAPRTTLCSSGHRPQACRSSFGTLSFVEHLLGSL